ncbi:MAG: (2Fe-2S)-binding protein [Blastocatellia bacterium]|nr:(2Fe-2S)-binding protein [Blastocatellia bacterium]
MSAKEGPLFEAFLNRYDAPAWDGVVRSLLPYIHEVDRTATRIWFAFFPLALARAFDLADDPEELARKLVMQGRYHLKDQIDSSHEFLYGHRYWPEVKRAVAEYAASAKAPASLDLALQIRELADKVAKQVKADESLLVAVTAIAFMTLQQVGCEPFDASLGTISIDRSRSARSPEQVLKARLRDDSQGLFGSLLGLEKKYTITFNENDRNATFGLIDGQHLTTAAAEDKRDYVSRDPRCTVNEGPIPVQCRSASCGTCWVGVLGGAERLSAVLPLERRRMKEFGYTDTDEERPLIRLACQSQPSGAVSIVIPPWNGVFGRFIRGEKSRLDEIEISGS